MASYLARRACQTFPRSRATIQQRSIHLTPVVQKKKAKVAYDDLFAEDAFAEEDLIKETAEESKVKASEAQPAPSAPARPAEKPSGYKKTKLSPAARLERFESQIKYIEPRLGRQPSVKNPRIKKRSMFTLVQLASSEEELRKAMELLPKYKEAGREIPPHFAEAFVRRCQELLCPPLALEVFGNYAKYNLALTQGSAQWLVHSLYVLYPLEKLMVATSLFPVYNLPPISEDLPTASMVAAACYKHATPESIKLAESLRPHVNRMLGKADISRADDLESAKKNKWVAWSLHKVNKASERRTGKTFVTPKLIPAGFRVRVEAAAVEA